MKRFTLSAAVVLAVAQILAAAPADAATREVTVRCGQGQKIGRAIKKALKEAKRGDKIKILLRGACKESPTIAVDDLTIESARGRATIEGTIKIVGARRVKVRKLRIKGAGTGVSVKDGATVDIVNNFIENNARNGIGVSNGSFARVMNNRITGNGVGSAFGDVGIEIIQSSVRSWGNFISGNGVAAVRVGSLGQFRSGNFVPPGRAVRESDRDILIERGCARGNAANTCGTSETRALDVARSGLADVRLGDVTGESRVDSVSNVLFEKSTVNGDISMNALSRLSVNSEVFGSGTINCDNSANDFYGDAGLRCTDSIPSPP